MEKGFERAAKLILGAPPIATLVSFGFTLAP
jgi:hypothetical protein